MNTLEKKYFKKHNEIDKGVKDQSLKMNKEIDLFFLLILKILKTKKTKKVKKMAIKKLISDFYKNKILSYIIDYANATSNDIINFENELNDFNVDDIEVDKIVNKIFKNVLITQNTLNMWLLKSMKKDIGRINSIIDTDIDTIKKQLNEFSKSTKNVFFRLLDAVVFSIISKIRNKIFEINEFTVKWSSILDTRTTIGCKIRHDKLYNIATKKPIGHNIKFEEPGIYHWGCRSIIIPIKKAEKK